VRLRWNTSSNDAVARRIIMGPYASLEGTNKDETGRKGIDIRFASRCEQTATGEAVTKQRQKLFLYTYPVHLKTVVNIDTGTFVRWLSWLT